MLEDIAYVLAEGYAGVSNLMWGAHCAAVTAEKFTPSASVHYCLRLEWQLTSPSRCAEPRWTCYAGHGIYYGSGLCRSKHPSVWSLCAAIAAEDPAPPVAVLSQLSQV